MADQPSFFDPPPPTCPYCGGDASSPNHWLSCDGRQGKIEALEPQEQAEPEEAIPEEEDRIELHARASDPTTSHEAMAAYDPDRMSSAVEMVVELYKRLGPMSDYQLQVAFDTAFTQPHCRHLYQQARSSARDLGRIHNTGEFLVNPTTNRRQIVWAYSTEPAPPLKEFCPTCGALRARDGVKRRRKEVAA